MTTIDPGPRPEIAWLPVDRLTVDHRYQRTLESRRSQKLIEAIAGDFRWSAFQAILAVRSEGQALKIIDGQHRVEAARRAGVTEVPGVVLPLASLAEQAAAFVRANTDRVAVNEFALHHARLAAGDPEAEAIDRLCRTAGVAIPRYPIPADKLKPGQTLALGTITKLPKRYGDGVALLAMRTVASANLSRVGAIRAPVIQAVALLLGARAAEERTDMADKIVRYLTAHGDLTIRALNRRAASGGTMVSAMADIIKEGAMRLAAPLAAEGDGFLKPLSREQLMRGR
jgi:hypothetical protein